MQNTIRNNEEKPKVKLRLNCLKNIFINNENVTSLYVFTSSRATSIITVPIKGKIKNNMPKIGVTW